MATLSRLPLAFFPFFALLPSVHAFQQAFPSPVIRPASVSAQTPPNPALALEEALKKQRASLEIQRQAIHTQLGQKIPAAQSSAVLAEQFITPLITFSQPAVNQADCPALDRSKINDLVSVAAQKQSLDPALLKAVIRQESGFKPCVVSSRGAQGLMQLMPATARELHVSNPFDPEQNIRAGAAYLKQMLERYGGDLRLALVGYNAGPGRADQGDETPYPLETQNYVANILNDVGLDQADADEIKEDLAPANDAAEQAEPANRDTKPALNAIKPVFTTAPETKLSGWPTKP
jgi:soluble lytic murein transglycosylase-like protein